jgi:hypothetical protein
LLAARALSVSKESNSGELVCFVFLLLFAWLLLFVSPPLRLGMGCSHNTAITCKCQNAWPEWN